MVTDPPSADSEDYLSEMLTQHCLQAACGQTHSPVLPHDHFKQFLAVASSIQVRLSPDAKQMLQSFYISSRRVRTSSIHSSDVPNSALNSMCAIALAHARLSLRTEVKQWYNIHINYSVLLILATLLIIFNLSCKATEADAVLAISLYEESYRIT